MSTPIEFTGGLTISFESKDRKRSVEWYGSRLGFKFLYDVPEIGWSEVATSVPGVNIGFGETPQPKSGAGPVPTFGVKDIDAARKSLEKQGVKFDGETQTIPGMVKLATFFDPDGHALMLFQELR